MKSTFHHGDVKKSHRLRQVLFWLILCDCRGDGRTTTMEILNACPDTTRPSSDISELRANGVKILTTYVGKSANGSKVWSYKLIK